MSVTEDVKDDQEMSGDELRAMRKVMAMSQGDLAAAIGMRRETIGQMETGKAPIERRTELAVRYLALQRRLD